MTQLTMGELFAGIAGFGCGFEEASWKTKWQVEKELFCLAILNTHFPETMKADDIRTCRGLTSSVPASHAKTFPWQEKGPDSTVSAQDCFSTLRESCASFDPLGLSSRMFPDFSVQTPAETLQKSSAFSWSSAGMGFAGVCSTASFSESPNDADVCTLSDVLDAHVPPRFYLSAKACEGVLRRAEVRGVKLSERLQQALTLTATTGRTPTPGTSSPSSKTCADTKKRNSTGSESANPALATRSTPSASTRSHSVAPTLSTKNEQASSSTQRWAQMEQSAELMGAVRRLTPCEWEILQSFPRGWTLPGIEHWGTRSRST